ncbi:hypothetical protein BDZ85DRAFT_316307 [Elsinoe ampelina]|uniref:BZIP domain-containing protein n=1 Tax=Elsinoe ampelina TaxID=302913 RepID=A0A6A6GM84_9PEZI|nr:hypothetical protein BDZ85DRAFT_316307 [Elsinoe ampelina]
MNGLYGRASENLGPLFISLTSTLTLLSLCTLLFRWTVRINRRNPWWDDYAITLTVALAIARTAIQIATIPHGNGRHYEFLSVSQQWSISKLGYFTQLTWFPASGLIKVSICLLVLRIRTTKLLRRMLYPIMLGAILLNGYNVTTDLICASLPVIAVWNLHLKRSRKLLIYALVFLGLTAAGCSVGRATALSLDPMDSTWTYCIAALWSNFELHISIISVNSTTIPAFIEQCVLVAGSSSSSGNPASLTQQTIRPDQTQTFDFHQGFDLDASSWDYLNSSYSNDLYPLDSLFPPTTFDLPVTTMTDMAVMNATSHDSTPLHDFPLDFMVSTILSTSTTSPALPMTSASTGSGLSSPSSSSIQASSSSTKRRAEHSIDESVVDKRRRNNAAAAKYRQKKVDRIATLEDEVRQVSKERDELRLQLARRDAEIEVLRGLLKRD